jgi:nucleotide-binding universal stress UspA family protein
MDCGGRRDSSASAGIALRANGYLVLLLVVGSPHHSLLERLLARPADEVVARRATQDVLLVH